MRHRAILLDAAGTLFQVRGSVGAIYAAHARRFGVEPDPGLLDRGFRAAHRAAPPLVFPGAAAAALDRLERGYWRAIVWRAFEGLPRPLDFDGYFEAVFEAFRGSEGWELYPEVAGALESLRCAGLSLAVVTNFDRRCRDVLAALGVGSYFATVTCSSEVGAAKPDPRIFQTALASLRLDADQALMVGDNLDEDIRGAAAAGLRAILLDRRRHHFDAGVEVIHSLAALADLPGQDPEA